MRRITLSVLGMFGAICAPCAMTQEISGGVDFKSQPSYGSLRLTSGFAPDPHVVQVHAGGPIDATKIGPQCAGQIASAPDVGLTYQGGAFPLRVTARGKNVVLVVSMPDGSWACAAPAGSDAAQTTLAWSKPVTGRYDFWVGTTAGTDKIPVKLEFSERLTE